MSMSQRFTYISAGSAPSDESDEAAVRAPRLYNGALVVLQRGPYGDATAMPLQTNGGLTARRRGFFGAKTAVKNSPIFSLQKSREGLTGTKRRLKCVFSDVRLVPPKTNEGLTGDDVALEWKFLQG